MLMTAFTTFSILMQLYSIKQEIEQTKKQKNHCSFIQQALYIYLECVQDVGYIIMTVCIINNFKVKDVTDRHKIEF